MPYIKITENELPSLASFDVTENTVLIPVLYAKSLSDDRKSYKELTPPESKLYTSARALESDMKGHIVILDGNLDDRTGGIQDRSYIMAYELLLQGLNVVVKFVDINPTNSSANIDKDNFISEEEAYEILETAITNGALKEFESRNVFNIKFITSGGYANVYKTYTEESTDSEPVEYIRTGMCIELMNLAAIRKDAVALVELQNYIKDVEELVDLANQVTPPRDFGDSDKYSAAFFPWVVSRVTSSGTTNTVEMPACFAYLMAYAKSVRSNANWFAAAGVTRGVIPGIKKPVYEVNDALMHLLQGDDPNDYDTTEYIGDDYILNNIAINPIYNAGTYGYKVWGNRVFKKPDDVGNLMYSDFLNVRLLLCDIRKQIYHAAMRVTFEPNDDIVWINFKTLANTLLEKMKSGRGIKWYKWTKIDVSEKALIKATLTIQPIEAVESFDFTIVLTDEGLQEDEKESE